MNVLQEVSASVFCQGAESLAWTAEAFRDAVAAKLRELNFTTRITASRIAIDAPEVLAVRGEHIVAIEFDKARPRERSLERLQHCVEATLRVVALRSGHCRHVLPMGLDAIICAWPPRCYSAEQPRGYLPRKRRWP